MVSKLHNGITSRRFVNHKISTFFFHATIRIYPCKLNEGDCDNDMECEGDLVCGKNNCGNSFSWITADCCVKKDGNYFAIYKPPTCNYFGNLIP